MVPSPVSHPLNTMQTKRLIYSYTIKRKSHGLMSLSALAEKARTLIILIKLMVIFKSSNKGGQTGSSAQIIKNVSSVIQLNCARVYFLIYSKFSVSF